MGVTIPEWSAVMLLSGSANTSASGYMQTIFRVQSVGSVNGKQKTAAYVFDFAPDRTLKVLSEVHRLSADPSKQTDADARNALGEFLNFCPVIAIDGTRMQPYDVAHLMRQLKRITVDKAIKSGFDDESIYKADTGLVMTDDDRMTLKLLSDVVDGQARSRHKTEIVLNQQGLTSRELEQGERIEHKPERERTPQDRELLAKLRAQRDRRKKMIQLLRAVSIRLPMLIYGMKVDLSDKIDFETLIDKIDNDSWVEFMPCGLGKDLFKQITL